MIRIFLFFFYLLHFLPLPLLRVLGHGLGLILYALARARRRIARINLEHCFPELDRATRERWVRTHFRLFGASFLDRAILWYASEARLRRLIRLEGEWPADGVPTILLAPHFVGMDAAWARVSMERQLVSIYARQKNPAFDRALLRGRLRFNHPIALSRQEGVRAALVELRKGMPFYYLPDMDFGARDAVFVPFFGVPAATVTAPARLARLARARVIPCIARMTPTGYTIELHPPRTDYPTGDLEADTRRMNACIEEHVRRFPEQYYWLHKRFKTRPPGAERIYP